MISEEENEVLTRVGPGTPCGALSRRYSHPIAAITDLERNPTKRVRLLGKDLVLFRIAWRDKERPGASDAGLILYRKLLADNIQRVKNGQAPMNTFPSAPKAAI